MMMTKVKVFVLSAIMLCGVVGVSAQSVQEAGAKFDEARELVKANKIDEAMVALEKSIEMVDAISDDENATNLGEAAKKLLTQLYLKGGIDNIKAKSFDEAILKFNKAEELAMMYGIGDLKRQASRLGSSAYLAKGIDMFNNKDFTGALEVFKKGYEQDKKNIKLVLFIGQAYAETGDLAQAGEMFKQVIEAGAENSKYAEDAKNAKEYLANYMLVAAQKEAEANNLSGVITEVDKVLVIDPTNSVAQLMPIQLANNLTKYDTVIERGVEALKHITDEEAISNINLLLGIAYQNKDNKAKALESLAKVTGSKAADAKAIIAEINK